MLLKMWLPFTYSEMLLLILGMSLLFVAAFVMRHHWQPCLEGLQSPIIRDSTEEEVYQEVLVPLMVLEERFPSFGQIIRLVSDRFPLDRFLQQEAFLKDLQFLTATVFSPGVDETLIKESMCRLVVSLVRDPDVEYCCRPQLYTLVESFLNDIEA